MRNHIEMRALELAAYMVENKATVRAAARRFGVSKSTVHKDVSERIEQIDRVLAQKVRAILEVNKAERHIRGGIATREKYLEQHIHIENPCQTNGNTIQ